MLHLMNMISVAKHFEPSRLENATEFIGIVDANGRTYLHRAVVDKNNRLIAWLNYNNANAELADHDWVRLGLVGHDRRVLVGTMGERSSR